MDSVLDVAGVEVGAGGDALRVQVEPLDRRRHAKAPDQQRRDGAGDRGGQQRDGDAEQRPIGVRRAGPYIACERECGGQKDARRRDRGLGLRLDVFPSVGEVLVFGLVCREDIAKQR